ncbi:MAG: methionine gamma-lyase family protein, partial [Candidatus Eremiobacteraeota bacterium]|nr:methionine gamma-lyase family protein [Candidatus Eremiobacteraeota bacterium]
MSVLEALCDRYEISDRVKTAAQQAFERVCGLEYPAQQTNKFRIVEAFMAEGLAESDLAGSTGYGYDDAARQRYESLLSRLFATQGTFARLSIVSGTHAIAVAIAACVEPGRMLLSVTGRPYDTLRNAIVQAPHSLAAGGMQYHEVALREDGDFDRDAILAELQNENIAAVFVQRSRG